MLLVGRTDNNQNKAWKSPLSCLSYIAKTFFSRQQKTSGFNSLGFVMVVFVFVLVLFCFFFFIKQRLLNTARVIYSRNPDALKKEKRQVQFTGY